MSAVTTLRRAVPGIALLTVIPLGIGGCSMTSSDSASQTGAVATSTTTTPAPGPLTSAAPADPLMVAVGTPGEPQDITTSLDVPWDTAVLPDGTALVTLRDQARVVQVGPGLVNQVAGPGPDGTVPDVAAEGEGGLLGIALSPMFATDRHVFLYFTARDDNRIIRYTYEDAKLSDPFPILTGIPKNSTHNGGRLRFGPDGMLYIATGDAQNRPAAQDVNSLGGKILRVTAEGEIPEGNPFPGSRTWSFGHRNPQGIGWDTAGRMIASEFGQDTFDELNVITRGGNYGWPEVEGPGDGGGRFVAPVQTWTTDEASPSGIAVTRDAVYMAALGGERLWRIPLNPDGPTGQPEPFLQETLGRLRNVTVGPDGTLWILTSNTFRGDPRPGDDRLVSVPLSGA